MKSFVSLHKRIHLGIFFKVEKGTQKPVKLKMAYFDREQIFKYCETSFTIAMYFSNFPLAIFQCFINLIVHSENFEMRHPVYKIWRKRNEYFANLESDDLFALTISSTCYEIKINQD